MVTNNCDNSVAYKNKHLFLTYIARGLQLAELSWLGSAGMSSIYLPIPGPRLKEQPLFGLCYCCGRKQNTRGTEPNHTSSLSLLEDGIRLLIFFWPKGLIKAKPKVIGLEA